MTNSPDHVPSILGIGIAVPEHLVEQAKAGERMASALRGDPESARFAKRIFRTCGVDTRYTCEPNLLEDPPYCRYAPQRALACSSVHPESITHLITVSCTGQYVPGLDAELVHRLLLPMSVTRIPVIFTGCAAGLAAINLARRIAASDPEARVLVVSVELCTIHIQPSRDREQLVAASFFGDGASSCVIGSADGRQRPRIALHESRTLLLRDSAQDMTWRVGDFGFELYLSPNVPRLIGSAIRDHVRTYLESARAERWAIHPGGRAILDTVRDTLGLPEEAIASSRRILRNFGNMSSATILFVMADMMDAFLASGESSSPGVAMAFGPGLTVEMATFTCVRGEQPFSWFVPDRNDRSRERSFSERGEGEDLMYARTSADGGGSRLDRSEVGAN